MQRNRIFFAIISVVLIASAVAGAQTSEWVWMGGSKTAGAAGVYGTQGSAATGNIPGARQDAFTWTDASGNLWLFGGTGMDSAGTSGELNDLWEFNSANNEWTWVSGSKTANAAATCGTPGAWSATYIPGPRDSGVAWADKGGNLWLFGGNGYDCGGKQGLLNDLWEYSPSNQEWTLVSGGESANASGNYGTLGGALSTNVPGAREGEDSGGVLPGWTDSDGNFWLFGGKGYDSAGTVDSLNDLWEYSPASGMWTWVSGSKTVNGTGVYGTQGVGGTGNTPSARQSAQAWKDISGNFWLHGGYANDVTCTLSTSYMCVDSPEIWEFNPVTKEWTWISGQDLANAQPDYGTQGVPSSASNPSGREMAASWVDAEGYLWLFSGYAFDSQLNNAPDDLWMYNTTNNQWTWVGGNSSASQPSVYGALGVPAATNWPDSRGIEGASATWVDAQGSFWLFGGESGNNSNGGYLQNDLWVYHASPAATPTFNVSGGTYTNAQTVTISDTTPGATIYYTTNGTTPTASSSVYSASLTVASTETIEAVAIASGYPTSAVESETYAIAPPTFSASNSGAITVDQGATTGNTSTITVTPSNGFTGTVALSCSVTTAPTNATSPVTCSIPSSVGITGAGVQTATLTANSTTTTTTGAYAITVTAQGGSITQTTVANVTVNSAPGFTAGSGGTTTMTVTPGSTSGNTGTINVAGTNGFSGTVTLSCSVATTMSGVDDMPTCSLNPTSVTISGTTAQPSTLTVNTTAATSAENRIQNLLWPSAGGTALALVMFFVSPRRRRNWLALLGAFVFLAIIGATGCGGGSSAGSGGGGTSIPGTTAGTYTVTVTGTGTSSGSSSSMTAAVGTVTLTVN